MAESLRELKRRIKSVGNTKKLTRAMEMVAAAKLRRCQDLLGQTKLYAGELGRMLRQVSDAAGGYRHTFFETRDTKKTLVFLITSDSGLCGSYNYNLFQEAEDFLRRHTAQENMIYPVGRQASAYCRRRSLTTAGALTIPKPQEIRNTVRAIIDTSAKAFLEDQAGQVFLIYTEFISMGSFKPKTTQLLPLDSGPEKSKADDAAASDILFEPSAESILERLIPHHLEVTVEQTLKEALVAEQVSRMMAMRQATDNANEMIESLTLTRNKARQASITKELIEVVSGSRALQLK